MTSSTDIYAQYLPLLLSLIVSVFLLVGSIVAIKSKLNFASISLLTSSILLLITGLLMVFLQVKLIKILDNGLMISEVQIKDFEQFSNYMQFTTSVNIFEWAFFAFSFVSFCSSIANIRKRNAQLEQLCDQMNASKGEVC